MNVIYLVLMVVANTGVTSVTIPQANMNQCTQNAQRFNHKQNIGLPNTYVSTSVKVQSAFCVSGVK